MNVLIHTLQGTIDRIIYEITNKLHDDNDEMGELKSAVNAHFRCETKPPSVYTIRHSVKNWIDADLSCKAEGGHLVSFETEDEQNHVIQKRCPVLGFWTSARDLGGDNWIWRNSEEAVLNDVWRSRESSGDGDCGRMHQACTIYLLNDLPCEKEMCFICKRP